MAIFAPKREDNIFTDFFAFKTNLHLKQKRLEDRKTNKKGWIPLLSFMGFVCLKWTCFVIASLASRTSLGLRLFCKIEVQTIFVDLTSTGNGSNDSKNGKRKESWFGGHPWRRSSIWQGKFKALSCHEMNLKNAKLHFRLLIVESENWTSKLTFYLLKLLPIN